ncbi:amidohydrolase family protein [Rhodobacteraceae bacterium D3-12]|nr:amidohydrolase family protein [Rhodobacteraceae bacterium D3-12]
MRSPEEQAQWLASHTEEIIDPTREITDPHHHLWAGRLGTDYELAELWEDTEAGHNISKTVFIECGSAYKRGTPDPFAPIAETRYVVEIAEAAAQQPAKAQIAGIVAHADLRLPIETLDKVLDAHEEAGQGLFRGIRHAGAWDEERDIFLFAGQPTPQIYLDPDFQRGLRHLGARGLTYDTWHFHPQNGEFLALAQACPDTTIILDHFGTPLGVGRFTDKREAYFAQWQGEMAAIADCPNVVAKLGGLAMPTNGFGWDRRDHPPTSQEFVAAQGKWYDHMIACFGAERAMFESNFPVDRLSVSYAVYWNAMKRIAAPCQRRINKRCFRARRTGSMTCKRCV